MERVQSQAQGIVTGLLLTWCPPPALPRARPAPSVLSSSLADNASRSRTFHSVGTGCRLCEIDFTTKPFSHRQQPSLDFHTSSLCEGPSQGRQRAAESRESFSAATIIPASLAESKNVLFKRLDGRGGVSVAGREGRVAKGEGARLRLEPG